MTVKEAVTAGFALLDREKPGWYTRIDRGRLDVSNTLDCPLGQSFADDAAPLGENPYLQGIATLFGGDLFTAKTVEHGFACATYAGFDALTAEWKAQITARLAKDQRDADVAAAVEWFTGIGKDEWDALIPSTHLVGLG